MIVVAPEAVPPAHLGEVYESDQTGCARCGADEHLRLVRSPLTVPIDMGDGFVATHWTPCPVNGEPILLCQGPGLGVA